MPVYDGGTESPDDSLNSLIFSVVRIAEQECTYHPHVQSLDACIERDSRGKSDPILREWFSNVVAWLFGSFGQVVSECETLKIREPDGLQRLAPSSNRDHHHDLSRWDLGSEMRRILLLPSREKREIFIYITAMGMDLAKLAFEL